MQAAAIQDKINTMSGTIEKIQGQIKGLVAEGKTSNDREIDRLQRDRDGLIRKRESLQEQLMQVKEDEKRQERREQESRQAAARPGRAHEAALDAEISGINKNVDEARQELKTLGDEIRAAMGEKNPDEAAVNELQERREAVERKAERLLLRAEALEGQRGQARKKDVLDWLPSLQEKITGKAMEINAAMGTLDHAFELINESAEKAISAYNEIIALIRDVINKCDVVGAAVPALPEIPLNLCGEKFFDLSGELRVYHGELTMAMDRAASFRRYMAK